MQLETSEKVSWRLWCLRWPLENRDDFISRDEQKAHEKESKNVGWKHTGNVCVQCRFPVGGGGRLDREEKLESY